MIRLELWRKLGRRDAWRIVWCKDTEKRKMNSRSIAVKYAYSFLKFSEI